MSRIGKKPVTIPAGVEVSFDNHVMKVKGPKGELTQSFEPEYVSFEVEGAEVTISRSDDSKTARARHGLYRTLLSNMFEGVMNGYKKSLEIRGVGYRGQVQGQKVVLNLGYSHQVEHQVAEGLTAEFDKDNNNVLHISGIDKQSVGQEAAKIRSYRKPEPYKGKGIRYVGEHVAMKAGKSAAK